MKLLPYYSEEHGAKFSGAIRLSENKCALSADEALKISDYMSSCVVIDEWLSNIADVLTGKFEIASQTWSDGSYIWCSSHIHYVRKYRARLPLNFVEHVRKQIECGFDPSVLDKEELKSEFQRLLQELSKGNEAIYDGSY